MYESRLTSIPAYWDNSVHKLPRAIAFIWEGRSFSYGEVDDLIARFAAFLVDKCGFQQWDRLAIALPNCLEFVVAYWAGLRLGGIVAPINTKLRADELEFVVQNIAPKAIVTHDETWGAVGQFVGDTEVLHVGSSRPDGASPFAEATSYAGTKATVPTINPPDVAVILHTSGTTGQPKGAIMTHETLFFNVRNAILAHSFRHEDVHLLTIPVFAPTCSYSLLASSAYLGSAICIAPRPSVNELIPLLRAHGCTTFIGVPTLFHLATNEPGFDAEGLPGLRLIAYSGSPMPARTIKRLRESFPHVALHNFFGLTETIAITHVLPSKDAATRPESIGKALPEIYTKIIDDAGDELGPGEIGELCLRRENIIPGYWNRPGLLDEAIQDGWFRTGDYALVDEEGYFYVQGRKKEMIIVAGQNVYALEVEGVILKHDGVREAAVIGIPATGVRAALGEMVKAVIVPQADVTLKELDIKRHCAQLLPSYKVPQVVEFRTELPKNATGKVMKREL